VGLADPFAERDDLDAVLCAAQANFRAILGAELLTPFGGKNHSARRHLSAH
jgi:hypothetical protein